MSLAGTTPDLRLRGRVIAVVGGDEREQEIARRAALTGATVRAHGFPWPDAGIAGVRLSPTAAEALRGADYLLLPIPGLSVDGALYAPSSPVPIVPDRNMLATLRPGATIVLGTPDRSLQAVAAELGLRLVPYEDDKELMLLRAPAIVEGAIQLAIENTDVTLHGNVVAVVGHGTIGRVLARTLVLLGAHVTVFARNPVQRADAVASGCAARPIADLETALAGVPMVMSTVPTPLLQRHHLGQLPPGALVMDLAAPPGGIDLQAAQALGHRAVWARGLGRRAPVTVGASQWHGIAQRIARREAERSAGEG